MELEKGYKQTEIGLIPEDWELITYDAAFLFLSTATYSRAELSTIKPIKYVHYGDIHTRFKHFLDLNSELPTITENQGKRYSLIKNGDLIMADASEDYEGVGKSVEVISINNENAISGLHTFLFRDRDHYFVNGFKAYISENSLVKNNFKRLATGMKVYGVSKTNLKTILIPKPPIEEQQAIAQVLTDTDQLIQNLKVVISKKKAIKQGAMQELLTGKKRLNGFTDEWNEMTLKSLCSYINDGTHYTPTYVDKGIPFYSVESLTKNDFDNVKYITEEEHLKLITRCKPERGDILLTRIGTLGITKLIDWEVDASIYVSLALLKVKTNNIDSDYLYSYTKSDEFIQDILKRSLTNATPQKINMCEIGEVPIFVPKDINEQKAIARILSDMDAEIESLKVQLQKTENLKQGMMQELLTGKIRLVKPVGQLYNKKSKSISMAAEPELDYKKEL